MHTSRFSEIQVIEKDALVDSQRCEARLEKLFQGGGSHRQEVRFRITDFLPWVSEDSK